jgi:NTE family protein
MPVRPDGRKRAKATSRIGLALAGGGPLGAMYEIGALCALQESLDGIDFTRLAHYVGVSSGGFVAAALANGITPSQMCQGFIRGDPAPSGADTSDRFDPASLMLPAYGEFVQRALRLPQLLLAAAWNLAARRHGLLRAIEPLAQALPVALLRGDPIDRELARLFGKPGRSNDFRELSAKLTVVATLLDNGEAVSFGRAGFDHVPISKAVQASAALPGLFAPVDIDGRLYVDGALKKTLHASVALEDGVELLICINPLVPLESAPAWAASVATGSPPGAYGAGERRSRQRASQASGLPRVADGGLVSVLGQTFRTLIHSRMALGMKGYERSYPGTDIWLIEPDHRDQRLHQASLFSYRQRGDIAELAYQRTRAYLRRAPQALLQKLARHGVSVDRQTLAQPGRRLIDTAEPAHGSSTRQERRGALAAWRGASARLQESVSAATRLAHPQPW